MLYLQCLEQGLKHCMCLINIESYCSYFLIRPKSANTIISYLITEIASPSLLLLPLYNTFFVATMVLFKNISETTLCSGLKVFFLEDKNQS